MGYLVYGAKRSIRLSDANLLHECIKPLGRGGCGVEFNMKEVVGHSARQIRDRISLPSARIAHHAIVVKGVDSEVDNPRSCGVTHAEVARQCRAAQNGQLLEQQRKECGDRQQDRVSQGLHTIARPHFAARRGRT